MNKVAEIHFTSDAPGAVMFLLGNEAIARGALEAGVQVVAAYPGTPSSEITDTLVNHAAATGIYAEWSINEKVALEVAMAASISGLRALSIMKHVGVNVAHDPLMSASYMGARGGLVLISADDPGQWSSQNEQDNRYIARQAYIPVLEPCSAQEAKDMMADAFNLSEKFGQMFMLRSVTRIGHGRSDVVLGEINKEKRKAKFVKDPQKLVCLPANFRINRRLVVQRMEKIKTAVETLPYNKLALKKGAKLGIIACGIAYSYAMEAVKWLGLEEKISILKIGTPYPLPVEMTKKLLNAVPEILCVEELEPFVEDAVKVIAQDAGIVVKMHGKEDIISLVGELGIRQVAEALCKLTGIKPPVDFAALDKLRDETAALLPLRPPTMCAGCPHRSSFYAINVACMKYQRETGIEPVKTGDIGCYALGANPPLNADDVAVCMGGGFGIANGLAHVLDAPIVAHLGDGTFFHSGIPPMLNAVYNKANITMVVLDNFTTGMTGFQPHPGAPVEGVGVKIEDIARAGGVKFVEVVDAFDLGALIESLGRAIRYKGPSVIVARRACNIIDQREKRKTGAKTIPYIVDKEKCVAGSAPYCQATCPLHIDIRGYTALVKDGKFDEALALIKQTLPFPAIIGRVCTHPCEAKCKRNEVEEAISINALKRAATEYGKYVEDYTIAAEKPEKVAIVGGGPSGIMAAYDLRKAGYKVTIFEALAKLGGMMAVGIPEFRLPRTILNKETDIIKKLGVEIKLNTRVGKDIKLADLQKNYQAVFIAAGAHKAHDFGIENSGAKGVMDGTEFLHKVNTSDKVPEGDKVVVVGGGNVAIDCARTCLRLGFKDVTITYRRTKAEMPAIAEEISEAEREGVKLMLLSGPNKVVVSKGKATGLECLKMKLGDPDASGRRRPVPVANSEFVIEAGFIIAAVGEEPDLDFMVSDAAAAIEKGYIKADPVTLATAIDGVFAGGDCVTGAATVIQALAAGRKAAKSIIKYFKGENLKKGREGEAVFESKLLVDTYGAGKEPRAQMPSMAVDKRKGNFKEVELGLSREQAAREARRCLQCDCKICINMLGCPALITEDGKASVDAAQCPGCGVCAQVCPFEAIKRGE